jgi:hypothetical protein
MFSITTKEITGTIIIFFVIYLILYLDHKLNIKCDCENDKIIDKPSVKIPIIISLILLIIYKNMGNQICSYFMPNIRIKQNIITDVADF